MKVGEYTMEGILGCGSYGDTYRGKAGTETVAIKKLSKRAISATTFTRIKEEQELSQILEHDNLLTLRNALTIEQHYYLIFNYCNGSDLLTYRSKHSALVESEVRHVLRQLVQALDHIYSLKALPRSLKLTNILLSYPSKARSLSASTVCLGDYDYPRITATIEPEKATYDPHSPFSIVGTPGNKAPELFHGQPDSQKGDVWSLGTLVYELLFGKSCFPMASQAALQEALDLGLYRLPKELRISWHCLHFLISCLQHEAGARLEWPHVLSHPFLKDETVDPELVNVAVFIAQNSDIAFDSKLTKEEKHKFIVLSTRHMYSFPNPKGAITVDNHVLVEPATDTALEETKVVHVSPTPAAAPLSGIEPEVEAIVVPETQPKGMGSQFPDSYEDLTAVFQSPKRQDSSEVVEPKEAEGDFVEVEKQVPEEKQSPTANDIDESELLADNDFELVPRANASQS